MKPAKNTKAKADSVMIRMIPILKEQLQRLATSDRRTLTAYCRVVLEDHVIAKNGAKRS